MNDHIAHMQYVHLSFSLPFLQNGGIKSLRINTEARLSISRGLLPFRDIAPVVLYDAETSIGSSSSPPSPSPPLPLPLSPTP